MDTVARTDDRQSGQHDQAAFPPQNGLHMHIPQSSLLPLDDDSLPASADSPGQGRTKFAQLRGFENVKELRLVSKSSRGGRNAAAGPLPEQTFVLRGGFKMPKSEKTSITLAKSESLSPLPAIAGPDERTGMSFSASSPGYSYH
jgi:hypothetical protein